MGIDLEQLSPAPWEAKGSAIIDGDGLIGELGFGMRDNDEGMKTAASFVVLARNAFEVMIRRGWFPVKEDVSPIAGEIELAWTVYDERRLIVGGHSCPPLNWPDPFTALVEADRWYKEHVENG